MRTFMVGFEFTLGVIAALLFAGCAGLFLWVMFLGLREMSAMVQMIALGSLGGLGALLYWLRVRPRAPR